MRLLHLEHDPADLELVRETLAIELNGCAIQEARNREQYVAALRRGGFDAIISDFTVPGFDGLEALALAGDLAPGVPFIFFSGSIGEDQAIEALRAGAADYVIKDRMKRLVPALQHALHTAQQKKRLRAAELALRRSQESLEAAQALAHLGSWELDMKTGRGTWSAEMFRLMEVDPKNGPLSYVEFLERIHPKDRQLFREAEARGITERRAFTIEFRLVNRDGGSRWVHARGIPEYDADGRLERLFGTVLDTTEQKTMQEQGIRSQRMENLGMLAAGIAHDFNNILTPMLMVAPLLREQVSDPMSQRLLDTLEKSAERGASLVKQILAFSRGTGGERELIKPWSVFRDAIGFIEETFPRSIRLENDIPKNLPRISGNPTQIHQVLLNLCVNARDAMPNGGVLRLAAATKVIDEKAAATMREGRVGRFVLFEVSDTGTGIPEDVQRKMWEPFFTTKQPQRGTGLGLSTVRGIITSHDGFIDVHTAVGKGTTFCVFLPAVNEPALPEDDSAARGSGELILVADDDAGVRELTSAILTDHGYRVVAVPDGADAATIVADPTRELSMIVTDLHMPRMGGIALVQLARKARPKIGVIIVSGSSRDRDLVPSENPVELSDAFLLKPFKPDALLRAVHRVLQP